LQEYAAKAVFEHLKAPSTHDSLVKVGGKVAPCHRSFKLILFISQAIFWENTVILLQMSLATAQWNNSKFFIQNHSFVLLQLVPFSFQPTLSGLTCSPRSNPNCSIFLNDTAMS